MGIYNYLVKKPNGEILSMETYRGKTMLIVNTANQCDFTYQFEDLQKMYDKYGKDNFIVLGFPCNQFGEQNPEDGAKTIKLCQINYGVTFPIFEIVQVNGEGTHPLFNYLKHEVDFREFGKANMQEKMLAESIIQIAPSFLDGRNIRWNFTKFLVDNQGNIVERFEPTDSQLDIEQAIEKIL
ncbi:glutathione peroxidase [Lysinibacillus sphaericus]|uniref:glutathione peroxidase n=1 Tax=Lysinibacillus TaxID=400634 RepID=UPI00084A6D4D|nr:glutathione peroxidase [Lysinibacillus sphaericus]OEC03664.1 glutathione peroxidase [Lysinibacillus sphaericus]